jgi:hypothetical protein
MVDEKAFHFTDSASSLGATHTGKKRWRANHKCAETQHSAARKTRDGGGMGEHKRAGATQRGVRGTPDASTFLTKARMLHIRLSSSLPKFRASSGKTRGTNTEACMRRDAISVHPSECHGARIRSREMCENGGGSEGDEEEDREDVRRRNTFWW